MLQVSSETQVLIQIKDKFMMILFYMIYFKLSCSLVLLQQWLQQQYFQVFSANHKNFNKSHLVFAANSDFLIPISLQPIEQSKVSAKIQSIVSLSLQQKHSFFYFSYFVLFCQERDSICYEFYWDYQYQPGLLLFVNLHQSSLHFRYSTIVRTHLYSTCIFTVHGFVLPHCNFNCNCTAHVLVQQTYLYSKRTCTANVLVQQTYLYSTRTCTTHVLVQYTYCTANVLVQQTYLYSTRT